MLERSIALPCLFGKRKILNLSKYALASVILLLLFYFVLFKFIAHLLQNELFFQDSPCIQSAKSADQTLQLSNVKHQFKSPINVAVTICGSISLKQGLNAVKSALAQSNVTIHFLIMTDPLMFDTISKKLHLMRSRRNNFSFELRTIQYPNQKTAPKWRKLFKECASQRLFLPDILRKVDSILYIDTDVLFVSPVEQVWAHFGLMNSSQMAAMSYESEVFSNSWYHRFAKHPYYGSYGLNSGVMLMNLTRMRQFGWTNRLDPILKQYGSKIVWGDQDIINVIFNYNPDKLYLFGCNWNYRPDHCVYSSVCKSAQREGIRIVHGNRGVFLNDKQPEFKALFGSFERFELGQQTLRHLAKQIEASISALANPSRCATVSHLFWQHMANQTA